MFHPRTALAPLFLSLTLAAPAAAQGLGVVYTETNAASGNAVRVALSLPNGTLWSFAEFATGGDGTGGGLGSQAAIALSANDQYLFAANAGSDELTMFRALGGGLFLLRTATVASGGVRPTSVAVHGNLVYVLNAGSDSITGFRRVGWSLQAIPGATYALSQNGAAAAQVGFTPDGDFVVVTERATNRIDTFAVQPGGTLGAGQFQAAAGVTPFGFVFRADGLLVTSEATGGAAGASTVSTYRVMPNGVLQTIAAAAPTQQSAACWVAVPPQGHQAYTTNTGSGTVTGFALGQGGMLSLLDANGVTGTLAGQAAPIDAGFTANGRFLYVLDAGTDTVQAFRRHANGSLQRLAWSLPVDDGSAGLVVR